MTGEGVGNRGGLNWCKLYISTAHVCLRLSVTLKKYFVKNRNTLNIMDVFKMD